MARALRQILVRSLPAGIKLRLRDWWFRSFINSSPVPLVIQPDSVSGQVRVSVAQLTAIVLMESVLPDLRLHCQSGEHAGEMRAFAGACGVKGVLFDVGSHNGFFSLLYAAADVSNQVLAFEPSDCLRSKASHLARINNLTNRIEFSSSAVGDRGGSLTFFADPRSGFVQSQAFPGNEQDDFRPVTLQMTTLDDACVEHGLAPTLIKIDVEGYEYEVLHGARHTLGTYRPTIFLELHLNYLEKRGVNPFEVVRLLEKSKYEFFSMEERRLTGSAIVRSWHPAVRVIARPTV